ncbi:MAG: C40 family peptidase [Clostridia bacterium]|nr:C40 family peptidase [Clostridia bacterium]
MKKIKAIIALILSLSLLTPIFACKANEEVLVPETENTESTSPLPTPEEIPPIEEDSTPPPEMEEILPITPPTQPNTPSTPSTPEAPVKQKAQYIRITGDSVNVRSGAGTGYKVLTSSKEGTMYALIEKTGSWYKTYYRNQVAYISTSYAAVLNLEKSDTNKVEKVISEGYKLLGTPYVYGAIRLHDGKGNMLSNFSVHKFDCSSLIQYIFYQGAGKILDVTTRTQIKQGKFVKKNELQRGDCIFFTNEDRQYKTGIERVGHVALYLGDNYILHTASDYACIEKISAKRWSFYIEARRFL